MILPSLMPDLSLNTIEQKAEKISNIIFHILKIIIIIIIFSYICVLGIWVS